MQLFSRRLVRGSRRLVSAVRCPIAGGCQPELLLECTCEVTLVDEAGLDRQGDEPNIGADELDGRPLQTESPNAAADALSVVAPEGTCEMSGMYTDLRGDLRGRGHLAKSLV